YKSKNFKKTQWLDSHIFETPDKKIGIIEIYYSKENIELEKKESNNLNSEFLLNISTLIIGFISNIQLEKLSYDNTERVKELKGINRTAELLKKGTTLEESLQEICNFLPEAWQYPEYTVARITYEGLVFTSNNFKETRWVQKQKFETPDNKNGCIEIFYIKEFPELYEGPFLKEERNLIDNLAAVISGIATKNALNELLLNNTERLKELRGINQTSLILKQSETFEEALQVICSILPDAWQYPEYTAARIIYENKIFTSENFKETSWFQKQEFETTSKKKGLIEIYYLKEFPEADDGPFLTEERHLLINLSNLIAGSATKNVFNKLQYENKERLKELWAINQTSQIIAKGYPVQDTLQNICKILPKSWQYPKYTVVRIKYEGNQYVSKKFKDTPWVQKENFISIDNKKGSIEIFYTKEFPELYEGPFLKEERHLIINIGKLISGYLNNVKGREIYRKNLFKEKQTTTSSEAFRKSLEKNKQPLQLFFNKRVLDKYIYLDMMKYKVKEILFVATLYDAFNLEKEDGFFEQFMGEIYQYSLFSLPRITAVTSPEEALELLENTNFDLVILMVGLDKESPIAFSEIIKEKKPDLPIYLLLNQLSNIKYFEELVPSKKSIDKLFVWSGDSQILFAIVKSTEDQTNVDNDTKIGLVRIILLIEDSAQYYSKYLQMLYSIVFGQVQKLLPEIEKNELDKISKMRSRPKILLARNYEDAISIFNKYKDFLLCIISDIEFDIQGKLDKNAGTKFIQYVKSHSLNLPVILQSSEEINKSKADKLNVQFLNKNSDTLIFNPYNCIFWILQLLKH
ncbi:response regulator, partial [Bacteroidota bacterium]